jgi:hypothetical protein
MLDPRASSDSRLQRSGFLIVNNKKKFDPERRKENLH